jgi:hypothetical protein
MRQDNGATDIAIASSLKWQPALQANFRQISRLYMPGTTTELGAAIIYSLVFLALQLVDAGRMSVDRLIVARIPAWRRTAG